MKNKKTNYLEGKLVFTLGEDYERVIKVENTNHQSADDIRRWASKILNEQPQTFKELGQPELYIRRRYIMKNFNTKWEKIDL